MSRLEPLDLDQIEGLRTVEETYARTLGFVPNGIRIMARRPEIVKGFIQLRRAVLDPASGTVPAELKNLVAHMASKTHGCLYCQAHAIQGAANAGAEEKRLAAVWEYQTSDLFTDAERVALDLAVHAASVPNQVTDEDFERLLEYWDEGQVVEILAAIALYGFLNRWNDTLATPLEEVSANVAEEALGSQGWTRGKHVSEPSPLEMDL